MIILKAAYVISSPSVEKCPQINLPEYAFIGRSNVGKSSLINMLCNNQKLAKISVTPGKTQLINHYLIEGLGKKNSNIFKWYLVDLPGYGYAKISQSSRRRWEQMIENYLRKRKNLVNIFVLIDARLSPQKIDLEFINKLGEWNVPFVLLFTKADKKKSKIVEQNVKYFLDAMRQSWQFLPQSFVTSALQKQGRDEILNFIEENNKKFLSVQ